jgi:hypothetical protein
MEITSSKGAGVPMINEAENIEMIDRESISARSSAMHARAVGLPLAMGATARRPAITAAPIPAPAPEQEGPSRVAPPPPGRALPPPTQEDSGVQRVVNAVRSFMPIVQRLLPLIDGNIATAISNLAAPRPQAPPPMPKLNLAPLEHGMVQLQEQHRTLREQVIEQNASLKRVEDQLENVREATDRNTLEQQELLEDLKTFSSKFKLIAVLGIGVLAVGFVLNLILFLHIQRVLP